MRQFTRGERAKLSELAAINHIWEVGVSIDAPFFIADFCCLGLDADGQVFDDRYLISYNQPDAPQDAIRLDNASNNGAIFTLNLGRLPAEARRLVFTATLQQAEMPGGLIGAAFSFLGGINPEIGDGRLTLSTPALDCAIVPFSGEDFSQSATLILGEFYWRDEWRFVAAGQPLQGELSAFLQTLTEGPTRAPLLPSATSASAGPLAPPLAAPPRQSRPPLAPELRPPVSNPAPVVTSPRAPIATPTRPLSVPVAPTTVPVAQPVAQSVARPAAAAVPLPSAVASFPQSVPEGEKLQDLIDACSPGSTLRLMRDEYEGPITIKKPLTLEGGDGALWAKTGPVVTISAPDVVLRNLDVEVTTTPTTRTEGVALLVEGQAPRLQLDNVRVRGLISGLGTEDGEWLLPKLLDLGPFAARTENDFRFRVRVPTTVKLSSPVEGVSLSPSEIEAGEHLITLLVRDVAPETLLIGFVEVRSDLLLRTVPLRGSAAADQPPKTAVELETT